MVGSGEGVEAEGAVRGSVSTKVTLSMGCAGLGGVLVGSRLNASLLTIIAGVLVGATVLFGGVGGIVDLKCETSAAVLGNTCEKVLDRLPIDVLTVY